MHRILFMFLLLLVAGCHNKSFDSEKWKKWNDLNGAEWNLRWDMSDDLIDNYLENGMTIREVENLLCDSIGMYDRNDKTMYFNLGPCRSGISYGGLELFFEKGRLVKVEKTCR